MGRKLESHNFFPLGLRSQADLLKNGLLKICKYLQILSHDESTLDKHI